ncbi:MAG: amidohydrolase family protein [Chlorobi bacterium]|nr:amidohydrolase family protein [Chlorobiota bacterium]
MTSKTILFLAILFLSACNNKLPDRKAITVIKGGTVLDLSNQGNSVKDLQDAYIIFEGNEILEIGLLSDREEFPTNAKIIDANGKYVLPGLIDGFAVLNNQSYANAYLYSGVTTIIGVDGGRRGPFYFEADPSPGYYMLESVGDDPKPDSAHLADLFKLHEKGYKIALLKYELRPAQLRFINNEAHKLGMGTIGELGFTSYKEAANMGIDAFVHTTRYSLDVAPEEMHKTVAANPFSDDLDSPKWKYYQYLFNLDTADKALQNHAEVLASSETYLMPTMSLLYADLPDSKNPWDEAVAAILDPNDINNPVDRKTGRHNYTDEQQENYSAVGLQELKIETVYRNAGSHYLAGSATDVWGTMPGISLHNELGLLTRIGLSNREALAAATTNFNKAFGWKTGKIEKGFEADILILDKNPLDKLENLKEIDVLINNGKVLDRNNLLKNE